LIFLAHCTLCANASNITCILYMQLRQFFVQTMSILVVNQSVLDTLASGFMMMSMTSLVDTETTGLSHDSTYDQFICRFWLTRKPLWCTMVTSTYGILITTLSRYFAVIYPILYNRVRSLLCELFSTCVCLLCRPVRLSVYYACVNGFRPGTKLRQD